VSPYLDELPRPALPHALERIARHPHGPAAIFLDYDGTLTPIVDHPDRAHLSEPMRAVLARLAARFFVAVVSGRDRQDVEQRVALEGLYYAGSHGFDVCGPGIELAHEGAERAVAELARAESALRRRLADVAGCLVERKRFSLAVHVRRVEPERWPEVAEAVREMRDQHPGLRAMTGKCVYELQPDVAWDKGRAVVWLCRELGLEPGGDDLVLYLGDDTTDEDAFSALAGSGVGIKVGEEAGRTAAAYQLRDPDEVRRFLTAVAELAATSS